VNALARLPGAIIYLEGGASDWEAARRTAKQLRKIGIAKVRGFMLNATHYDWTRANLRHGLEISRRTGGKHFVINTAQNGRGPVHYRSGGRRINVWCNPGLRGLGPPPTTNTSHPKVDAYLWINRPWYAQSCQGRKIGWYPPRALSYARFATNWEAPPPGTRFGHFKRYPLSVFGVPR
jgi:endoglucanase